MPARNWRRPAAAIIAALSVESGRLGTNVGISRSVAVHLQIGAEATVCRDAAGDANAAGLKASRGGEGPVDRAR